MFLDHITTGDGTLAAMQLLAIMKKQRKPLSELATVMENFPQVLKNVRTSSQIDVNHIPDFAATVRGMEQKLGDTGRILVRPFGTESLIRVMIEGQDAPLIQTMADELCAMVSKAALG